MTPTNVTDRALTNAEIAAQDAAVAANPKPKVIQTESEFLTDDTTTSGGGPSIVARVEFDSNTGDVVIRVLADDLTFANSRPTSVKGKRMFCVKGDYDGREGLPGVMLATSANGETVHVPVKFSSLNFNLFASKQRS